MEGSKTTTTTTVYTQGQSNSSGWSLTVQKKYLTGGVHKNSGHGDKFVFLAPDCRRGLVTERTDHLSTTRGLLMLKPQGRASLG